MNVRKNLNIQKKIEFDYQNSTFIYTWVGAQNLKKPADSSNWRQKL